MGRRVLVVDDDVLVLELLASMLNALGCDTLTARSGTEALGTIAKDRTIEILISDLNMPGLAGSELAQRRFPVLRKPFGQTDLRRVMAEATGLC